jgi:hypothetical protein
MAVLDPDELLRQAEHLAKSRQPGPARQVDVRRAISASYYALFHCVVTAVADEFVGKTNRGDVRPNLVYRSVDHRKIKSVGAAVQPLKPEPMIALLLPLGAGDALRQFAAIIVQMQVQRTHADYGPGRLLRTSDVTAAVSLARQAMALFGRIGGPERLVFLTLIAFPYRT